MHLCATETAGELRKAIQGMEHSFALFPSTPEKVGGDPGTVFLLNKNDIRGNLPSGMWGFYYNPFYKGGSYASTIKYAFLERVLSLPGLELRQDAKVYSVPLPLWDEVLQWDDKLRPVSELEIEKDGKTCVSAGYALGGLRLLKELAEQPPVSVNRSLTVEKSRERGKIVVLWDTTFYWRHSGAQFSKNVHGEKVFLVERPPFSQETVVEVVAGLEAPKTAKKYYLDVQKGARVRKSMGATHVTYRRDAGPYTSPDGFIFTREDIRESTSLEPIWDLSSTEPIALDDVPPEVRANPQWAALELIVRGGGEEFRAQLLAEWEASEWARIRAEADALVEGKKTEGFILTGDCAPDGK